MAQRWGPILGVVALGFAVAGVAWFTTDSTFVLEQPELEAPEPTAQGAGAAPEGYAVPLSSGEYSEEEMAAAAEQATRLTDLVNGGGWRGETHRHVAAALLQQGVAPELRPWTHDRVDDYCDRVSRYEAAIEAGEMAPRDLAVNTEEALQGLERTLSPRLGAAVSREVVSAAIKAR